MPLPFNVNVDRLLSYSPFWTPDAVKQKMLSWHADRQGNNLTGLHKKPVARVRPVVPRPTGTGQAARWNMMARSPLSQGTSDRLIPSSLQARPATKYTPTLKFPTGLASTIAAVGGGVANAGAYPDTVDPHTAFVRNLGADIPVDAGPAPGVKPPLSRFDIAREMPEYLKRAPNTADAASDVSPRFDQAKFNQWMVEGSKLLPVEGEPLGPPLQTMENTLQARENTLRTMEDRSPSLGMKQVQQLASDFYRHRDAGQVQAGADALRGVVDSFQDRQQAARADQVQAGVNAIRDIANSFQGGDPVTVSAPPPVDASSSFPLVGDAIKSIGGGNSPRNAPGKVPDVLLSGTDKRRNDFMGKVAEAAGLKPSDQPAAGAVPPMIEKTTPPSNEQPLVLRGGETTQMAADRISSGIDRRAVDPGPVPLEERSFNERARIENMIRESNENAAAIAGRARGNYTGPGGREVANTALGYGPREGRQVPDVTGFGSKARVNSGGLLYGGYTPPVAGMAGDSGARGMVGPTAPNSPYTDSELGKRMTARNAYTLPILAPTNTQQAGELVGMRGTIRDDGMAYVNPESPTQKRMRAAKAIRERNLTDDQITKLFDREAEMASRRAGVEQNARAREFVRNGVHPLAARAMAAAQMNGGDVAAAGTEAMAAAGHPGAARALDSKSKRDLAAAEAQNRLAFGKRAEGEADYYKAQAEFWRSQTPKPEPEPVGGDTGSAPEVPKPEGLAGGIVRDALGIPFSPGSGGVYGGFKPDGWRIPTESDPLTAEEIGNFYHDLVKFGTFGAVDNISKPLREGWTMIRGGFSPMQREALDRMIRSGQISLQDAQRYVEQIRARR